MENSIELLLLYMYHVGRLCYHHRHHQTIEKLCVCVWLSERVESLRFPLY